MIRLERHKLGPRVYLLGRRCHEYQAGFLLLAASPLAAVASPAHGPLRAGVAGLAGLWLVVKDWPDLFPKTRDRASWRLGLHRLPRDGDNGPGP